MVRVPAAGPGTAELTTVIARAWYVRCDGPCGGNPAEISTESAKQARRYALQDGYGYDDTGEPRVFARRRVGGKVLDLCPGCKVLQDEAIVAWREGGDEALLAWGAVHPEVGGQNRG